MGPTPPRPGVNFPFPQNRHSSRCTYPRYSNTQVRAAYDKWKADLVTSDGARGFRRVKRSATEDMPNDTVSEGIAYGMLLAVTMDDQALFDDLWKYEQQLLNPTSGLMHWHINYDGNVERSGAASDADEDMAWALLMADRQWGGRGAHSDTYLNIAKGQIQRIWDHEIHEGKLLKNGDGWGDWNCLNVSYFAPAYYRVFATVTNNAGWNQVVTASYDTLESNLRAEHGNTTNGLVRGFSNSQGGVPSCNMGAKFYNYNYDACRVPFRIAQDWCWNGEPRAQAYLGKLTSFFNARGVANIVDGYQTNGTPAPEHTNGRSSAYIGPAGVGAMHSGTYGSFVQAAYDAMVPMDLLVGGAYYDESWAVMSMAMMSGNFLDYTKYTP